MSVAKLFANADAAGTWFEENNAEGVAFENVPEPFLKDALFRAPNHHAGIKWQNRVSARAPFRFVAKL
jgi:hypothetical protein